LTSPRFVLRLFFERIENGFDVAFGPQWNPFYQLGALGWFFYWIVIVSGIYVYIFFDSGITEAYQSIEQMTHAQWFAGGVMRSLHRYASDGLVAVIMLHLVREFALDRYRGKRWFAWLTGVPLLWLIYACGISGYWLVWDKLAQYVAIITTEWLDTLPFFGEPIARNFLNSATLSGRFFTLMVFIHIAVPLITLFIMWVHIQRHAKAKVNPPRGLALGTLGMLLVLSLAHPALSQGPADLDKVVATVGLDWFYLPAYPLLDSIPGSALWAFFGLATLFMFIMPWLPPAKREAPAVVDLANCNGCKRCVADCPFSAIDMAPRSDGLPFEQEAVVDPSHCTSCGLCAGACPTSTPFRRASDLVPGIDLPDAPLSELRERILAAKLEGDARVMVFACGQSGSNKELANSDVALLSVPCVGNVPPSFLDFVIMRGHADGVILSACRDGDCHYRLGLRWTEQRLAGERDPYLRQRVPRERIVQCWHGPSRQARLQQDLTALQMRLRELGPLRRTRATPTLESVN